MKKIILALIVVSTIALWPFFKKGYFESHDGEWMVIRFSAFHQTLRSGQFPVRFVDRLNNNYGYPVMNFLYPLPFYFAEIPKVLGFNFVDSIKAVFVSSSILSVIAMFWAMRQKFSQEASFAAAVVYLFIPYRFVDLYIRGSLGESVAFVFPPLILGSIFKISKGEKIYLPIMATFVGLLLLSHNVMAIFFVPLLFIYGFFNERKHIKEIGTAMILGALLSAFFTLPALYDLQFVKMSQIEVSNPQDHLSGVFNLISPQWGYGSNTKDANPLPVQFGIVSILLFVFTLYQVFFKKVKNTTLILFGIFYALSGLLMLKISNIFWQQNPFVGLIQFPWRLLSIVVFSSSIFAAYAIESFHKKTLAAIVLSVAAIVSTIFYSQPKLFIDRGDAFYSTNESTTTVRGEYMPKWVIEKPQERADEKIIVEKNNAKISSEKIRFSNYKATLSVMEPTRIVVNTIYFPGWQVKVDNQNVPINFSNEKGLITFSLPQGEHEVIIKYNRSSVHLLSELASLFALITTVILFLNLWRKQNS